MTDDKPKLSLLIDEFLEVLEGLKENWEMLAVMTELFLVC